MTAIFVLYNVYEIIFFCRLGQSQGLHQCFKCWWLALPEKKRITKPLMNSTLDHGLHEGPSYTVLTIIKELLRQFKS